MSSKIPITPLKSSLASKSETTALPSPDAIFIPSIKNVLRKRLLYRIFPYTLLISWALVSASRNYLSGDVLVGFQSTNMLLVLAWWITGVLPLLLIKKAWLSVRRLPTPTPASLLSYANGQGWQKTRWTCLAVFGSTTGLLATHIAIAYLTEESDPKLSFFVKSRKHPLYISPRLAYLSLTQTSLSALYVFWMLRKDTYLFPFAPSAAKYPINIPSVIGASYISVMRAIAVQPLAFSIFAVTRMVLLPLAFYIPGISALLRPFVAHFVHPKSSYTILLPLMHLPLILRSMALCFTTSLTWELTTDIFNDVVSRPVLDSETGMTVDSLASGTLTQSEDGVMAWLAYNLLDDVLSNEHADIKRKALYTQSTLTSLIRTSLLHLGNSYQMVIRRGAPPPLPAAPAPPAPPPRLLGDPEDKKPTNPVGITPNKILPSNSIFKPKANGSPVRKVVDALSSEGDLTRAIEVGTDSVPSLFKSTLRPAKADVVEPLKAKMEGFRLDIMKIFGDFFYALPIPHTKQTKETVDLVKSWYSKERKGHFLDRCVLGSRELDKVTIRVLTNITILSLTHDSLGILQRPSTTSSSPSTNQGGPILSQILEAFVLFLNEVESYKSDFSLPASATPTEQDEEVVRARMVLSEVEDALKEGLSKIGQTFGERKLDGIRMTSHVAGVVSGFI